MVSPLGSSGWRQAEQIAQGSPTAQKLVQEAQNKGVDIEFIGDQGDGVNGYFDPDANKVVISTDPNDIENTLETLAHECFHASNPENGNSMNEELAAFMIGEKAAIEKGVDFNHMGGQGYQDHVNTAYAGDGLVSDNGVQNALSSLGIDLSPGGTTTETSNSIQDPANNNYSNVDTEYAENDLWTYLGDLLTGGMISASKATEASKQPRSLGFFI